ncbi:MAG TPA: hypothetical protein VK147_01140 [Candidatus Didemnitutus sp.]|nr:hypothetical protein [Candidatus Didemnitutus sp.]
MRTCLETHLAWLNSPSWKAIDYVVETMTVGAATFTDTVHIVSGPGYFYSASRTNTLAVDEGSFVSVTHPSKTVLLRMGQAQPASATQIWEKLITDIMSRKVLKCDITRSQLLYVSGPTKKNSASAEYSMDQLSIVIDIESCSLAEFERTFSANGQQQRQKITVLSSKVIDDTAKARVDPQSLVYDSSGKLKPELKNYVVKDLR